MSENRRRNQHANLDREIHNNKRDERTKTNIQQPATATIKAPISSSPHVPNLSDHDHHHHHHHDHTKVHAEAVAYEASLYMTYLSLLVVVEFTLIFFHMAEWASDLLFILILLRATYDDLAYGPRCDKIHTLKEKIYFVTKILMFIFVAVFFFGCITDQFVLSVPLELQIEDTDGSVTEETLEVWTWVYRGFNVVRFDNAPSLTNASSIVFGGGPNIQGGQIIQESSIIDYMESSLNAVIHIIVCASKLAVARFLLLDWELTIKLLTRFIRTL